MRRKLSWFEVAISVVFLSAYVYAAFSDAQNLPNRWFIRDDAYYYFKVAQNISEGHGSTFDGIHATNGYHPLWMLICIPIFALARYDLILPLRVLVLVTGVLQLSTALLLYRLVQHAISRPAGVLAAAYWLFNSYILLFLYKTGVESCVAIFFIVWLLYLVHQFDQASPETGHRAAELVRLGAVAALAVFGRLDLVFFALVVGIWIVFRRSPVRYLLPFDLLAIFLSTLSAFILRLGFSAYYDVTTTAIVMAAAAMVIKPVVLYLLGLYERPSSWKPIALLPRLIASSLLSSAVLGVLLLGASYLRLLPSVSRTILLLDAGLTLAFVLLIRVCAYLFRLTRATTIATAPSEELKVNWRRWLVDGGLYYGIVGGGLSVYMLWNKLEFGSFSPVSGEVKRWWGTFIISVYGGPARTWLSFFAVDPYGDFDAWQPLTKMLRDWSNNLLYVTDKGIGSPAWQQNFLVVLAIAFVVMLLALLTTPRRAARSVLQAGMIPLFVGSWLQVLSYNATGYASPKEWYWLTEQLLLVMAGALLINVAYDLLRKRLAVMPTVMWALVTVYTALQGFFYWRDAYELSPYGLTPPGTPYADVVPFLEAHTSPGDIIGMTGGGNVGYFIHDRTIVNMDGLINSTEYFKDLQNGSGAKYLFDSGMRFVFANPALLSANPYRGQYEGRLFGIASWGGKDIMQLLPEPSE